MGTDFDKKKMKELTEKVCKKYNLINHGAISSWVVGLMTNGNRKKIYRRFLKIDKRRNSLIEVEYTRWVRIERDIFAEYTLKFRINITEDHFNKRIKDGLEYYLYVSKPTEASLISHIMGDKIAYTPSITDITLGYDEVRKQFSNKYMGGRGFEYSIRTMVIK